jgi:polyhydroxybutyrate depolymerase
MRRYCWPLVVALLVAGCSSASDDGEADPTGPTEAAGTTLTVDLDDRPFRLHVPSSYDPAVPAALVVLLHGYSSNAVEAELYFQLTAESDRRGFLYAAPDGTEDYQGAQFWNATPACCDFRGTGVDDAGYLRRLIETVESSHAVDTSRVYLVGHSNGGFMAHRMACENADVVTAIVSLAGAAPDDEAQCTPERPVSVLQIHGTGDSTIPYDGGANAGNPFPSAETTVAMWRRLDGCTDPEGDTVPPQDFDSAVPGPETTVTTYADGCGDGTRVALWSMADSRHVPALTAGFTPALVDFLYDQASPPR